MSTEAGKRAYTRTGSLPGHRRPLLVLVVLVSALVLFRSLSEGVYDITFANLAFDLSRLASTVTLVYFVGYGVEVIASVVAGPVLDRSGPVTALVGAYLAKIGVFLLIGLASTLVSSHLWTIIAAAATVDLIHRVGDMALFVLLPRILNPRALVTVQGIGTTVRSVGDLVSPAVAGGVLGVLPGGRALLAAAGLQVLALVMVGCLLAVARTRAGQPAPGQEPGPVNSESTGTGTSAPVSRRSVARVLLSHRAWRRFILLDTEITVALSSVILTLIPLMRSQLHMSPARSSVFMAFPTLGAVIGGIVVTRGGERGIYPSLVWAPALAGAGAIAAPVLGDTPWLLATALTLFGIGFTVYLRSAALIVQLRAPLALMGTWHGLIDAVERVACAVAILATGYLLDRFGATIVYAAYGILLLAGSAQWAGFSPGQRRALDVTILHPSP